MKRDREPSDREIEQVLAELRASYPPRQSEAGGRARTRFLCEVEALRQSADERAQRSLASQFGQLFNSGKEDARMLRVVATVVLAVTVALGGAGLTVSASQRALPRQSLYPVKLFTENVRTSVAFDGVRAAELQVDFAIERADEVLALAQQGSYQALDEAVERLEGQLERATEALEELWGTHPEEAAQLATRLEAKLAEVATALAQLPLEGVSEEARELIGEAIGVTKDGQQEVLELLGVEAPQVEDEADGGLVEEEQDEETPEIEEAEDDSEVEEDEEAPEIEEPEDDSEIEEDEEAPVIEEPEDNSEIEEDEAEEIEDDVHEEESPSIVDDDEHEETDYSSEHEEHEESGYTSGEHEHQEYDD